MKYLGKELSDLSLWDLQLIKQSHDKALAEREEAKAHPKFLKMPFPEPNPAFIELNNAIETEIKKRENFNAGS